MNGESEKQNAAAAITSPREFYSEGYYVKNDFLSKQECEHFLSLVVNYRQTHTVPQIYRQARERALNYKVIDGQKIREHLPEIQKLYEDINKTVNKSVGQNLVPLKNTQVGVNINITSPGGEYRWHYDRNEVTGILYLNSVEGGETECYPNYRLYFEKLRFSALQKWLDYLLQLKIIRSVFGRQVLLAPRQGTLLLMRGNRCLHSVRPVLGKRDRINIILSYDAPEAQFAVEQKLDAYLYNQDASASLDPNYK